jgi:hypothetical protein
VTFIRNLLDITGTVVIGLVVAVVFVALALPLALYVIASNWDWEYRA